MPSITQSTIYAILAAAVASASPVPPSQSESFTSVAIRSASPIQYLPLNARRNGIYLGGKTESYCPDIEGVECPAGKTTVFDVNSQTSTASLDTMLPGGQQLYIAPDGALTYTVPHSAYIGEGSYQQGFSATKGDDGALGSWTFEGESGASGFYACPTGLAQGEYRVYAGVEEFDGEDCLGFEAATTEAKGPGAYQYA